MNTKYFTDNQTDGVRGIITDKRTEWDPNVHIIDWEDGTRGNTTLSVEHDYFILV